MMPARCLLLPVVAALGAVVGDPERFAIAASRDAAEHVSRGIQQHQAGDFVAAAREFSRAAQSAPDDPRVLFDEACALAALQKWDDAADRFRKATLATDEKLAADSWYNLGWIAAQRGKRALGDPPAAASGEQRAAGLQHLQRAIDHYRSALQLDPAHTDARHNLELLKLLQQQLKDAPQPPQQQQQPPQQQQQPPQEPQQPQPPSQEERPPSDSDKSKQSSDPSDRSKSSPADSPPDTAKQPDPQDSQDSRQPSDMQRSPRQESPTQQSESQQDSQQSPSQQSSEMPPQSGQEKEGTSDPKSGPQQPDGKNSPSSATEDASEGAKVGDRNLSPEEREAATARQAAEMVLQRVREREREYRQLEKQRTRARSASVEKDW